MDFDIGNIIYIVFTLVAVVLGIIGKKKDPKKKPAKDGGGKSFMEGLEELLVGKTTQAENQPATEYYVDEQTGELRAVETPVMMDEEEKLSAEDAEWKAAIEKHSKPSLLDQYDQLVSESGPEGLDVFGEEGSTGLTEVVELGRDDEKNFPNYFELLEDFDARKAIVYSSIINRIDY